jgi:hypothetical protein
MTTGHLESVMTRDPSLSLRICGLVEQELIAVPPSKLQELTKGSFDNLNEISFEEVSSADTGRQATT